ncbi:MAG: radical SAM protein [Phycisphaerales bacterium]|nr:radical SAM protein [Phycisphaerales bacterium]
MNPLDTLIVKFAATCNLACTYCYEYAAGDESWRTKPKGILLETAERIGERIREFGESVGKDRMTVVAHGGEPLLLGAARLDAVLSAISNRASPIGVKFSLQTNGTLLTPSICAVLAQHQVTVGVSLDGSAIHNRRRIDHRGLLSYDQVLAGIETLRSTPGALFGGLLCVIDLEHDPEEIVDALCSLRPPMVDLLQPFLTHDAAGNTREATANRFGQWMCRAMDRWIERPEYAKVRIRVLDDALRASLTRRPETDWFGPRRISYMVIETDGTYDLLDQLKAIGAESAAMRQFGRTIRDCSLQDAARFAEQLLSERGGDKLPHACNGCRWADVCAGGHLPSRHSAARGFDNPSTYCEGILALLDHSQDRLTKHTQRLALTDTHTKA